jgi:hypothetical protein
MAATVTVNDVLDGHVALDVECLDRIYLNGYVPTLQTGGAVVSFLTAHLNYDLSWATFRVCVDAGPLTCDFLSGWGGKCALIAGRRVPAWPMCAP